MSGFDIPQGYDPNQANWQQPQAYVPPAGGGEWNPQQDFPTTWDFDMNQATERAFIVPPGTYLVMCTNWEPDYDVGENHRVVARLHYYIQGGPQDGQFIEDAAFIPDVSKQTDSAYKFQLGLIKARKRAFLGEDAANSSKFDPELFKGKYAIIVTTIVKRPGRNQDQNGQPIMFDNLQIQEWHPRPVGNAQAQPVGPQAAGQPMFQGPPPQAPQPPPQLPQVPIQGAPPMGPQQPAPMQQMQPPPIQVAPTQPPNMGTIPVSNSGPMAPTGPPERAGNGGGQVSEGTDAISAPPTPPPAPDGATQSSSPEQEGAQGEAPFTL